MENEILSIIIRIIYSDKIKKAYENREHSIDFPINLEIVPNVKVICDFNEEYFNKYEQCLVINSLIYALENNEENYLKFFLENINKLKNTLENDMLFRIKLTEFAIKNIVNKLDTSKNKLFFDSKLNEITIMKYKEFFEKINLIYTKIIPITRLYYNYLINFLSNFNDNEIEHYLDLFLTSNKYDKEFIKSTDGFIKENEIKTYKNFIVREIFSDNYLQLETYFFEKELDKHINELDKQYTLYEEDEFDDDYDNEDDYYDKVDKIILKYIYHCIEHNTICLPKDDYLRRYMLVKFLVYNSSFDKNYEIETLESNEEKILNLKKINPYYKLDLIDFD